MINLGCSHLRSTCQNLSLVVSPSGLQLLTHNLPAANDAEEVIGDVDIAFQFAPDVEDKSVLYLNESLEEMPRLLQLLKKGLASDTCTDLAIDSQGL